MKEEIDVGFTGTQEGMTDRQFLDLYNRLRKLVRLKREVRFHHGDCIGADVESDVIARRAGCKIHIHPCTLKHKRAYCYQEGDVLYPEKPPLERNNDLASQDFLFVAPKEDHEVLRSGTWSTKRRAVKFGTPYEILYR